MCGCRNSFVTYAVMLLMLVLERVYYPFHKVLLPLDAIKVKNGVSNPVLHQWDNATKAEAIGKQKRQRLLR